MKVETNVVDINEYEKNKTKKEKEENFEIDKLKGKDIETVKKPVEVEEEEKPAGDTGGIVFGKGPPAFAGYRGKKQNIIQEEYFPEIGGKAKAAPKKKKSVEIVTSSSGGPPVFKSKTQNRFVSKKSSSDEEDSPEKSPLERPQKEQTPSYFKREDYDDGFKIERSANPKKPDV